METISMNRENRKPNELHKSVLNLSQRLDLKSLGEHVALQIFFYYTWKNKRKQHKKNKFKVVSPARDDEFELPDGSYYVSDIHNYIKYIIKKT